MSLYGCVTADQVNSTRALLKILRFMHVCGLLEIDVTAKYGHSKVFAVYCIEAKQYYPNIFITEQERIQSEWLESFRHFTTVSS